MNNGLVAVLPVLDEAIGYRCVNSIVDDNSSAGFDPDDILIVDNTKNGLGEQWKYVRPGDDINGELRDFNIHRDPDGHNLGVARAWNVGARKVLEQNNDYLVILSASMLFGPELHTTFVAQMERFWGETVIEADGHSWHLIALHRRIFEEIGLFDENFYPAYFESIDFGYRMRMVRLEHSFRHVWVNAMSTGVGQHVPMIDCPAKPLLHYYQDKWGGPKGEETFVQPWGNRDMGYFPTRNIPDLATQYGLSNWW